MVYEPKSVVIHYESQSGTERSRRERENVERLKRGWTGRVAVDFVIQPDGRWVKTDANRMRPYSSPVHAENATPEPLAFDKITEVLQRVEAHVKNDDLETASQVLTEAVAQTPGNPDLIVALGHVVWKQGDLEKARLQFVRAATLEPNHVQAHTALAILFLQQSQFAEAEEAARKALAIDKAEITTLKVLAKICLDTERYQEAVQAYATILEHAPDDLETLILVGNCYAETGRFEQARSFYQKVLALNPGNVVAAENLAEVDRLASASNGTAREPIIPEISEGRPSASIVIVTYNSAATIRACLDSVLCGSKPAMELIIVDNTSTDGTQAILDGYRDRAVVILNSDNAGFSAACNQGIRASSGEYIVLLNPDTVVTSGWLDRMIAHVGPGVGAVGPVSDYAAELQNINRNLPDGAPRRMGLVEVADLLGQANNGQARETKVLIGFCMVLPRKVLDDVGLLDEELFLGNDDLDLSWRMRLRGYKLLVATDTFVHHEGQVSFKSEAKTKTSRLVQESTDRLYAKLETHYGVGHVPSPMELWGITWFKPTKSPHPPFTKGEIASFTSIIILTHNGLAHTKKCLASIDTHTPEPHDLIIVDNASTDGTLGYLRDYTAAHDNTQVVANLTNRGFAAGNNQGLALARGEYALLLNNDTIVTQGWLKRMLQVFNAHPDVGIVGPMSNYVSGPQLVRDASYEGPEGLEAFAAEWARGHDGQSADATRVVGFCLLTRKEVITRIGGLDEQFGSGNFEDDDFCIRAFQVGFRARIALDAFIHHTGSQTFKVAKIDYRQSLMRNWELFKAKWGIPADAPHEKGYRFPPQTAQGSDLSIPLPDVGADHRREDQGRWWQEFSERPGRSQSTVTREAPLRVVIVPNGHGLAPLWPSLVQHTTHPLAITILPSHGNGNGDDPAHEVTCPDGWRISTSDLSAVRLFNQLVQSAHDDPVILLSSGLILTPGWLKRLLAALKRDSHIAVVGPTSNGGAAPQRIKAEYKGTGKALRQFVLRRAHRYGEE
ncbi:glycosyltransferase, partial [Candidatus Methylomirabilis sp.]|uniref:glycosyltransferase n=1 Tax=Candidatus Methylomirabilis sp. TaxID=2032687 RepID=UPI003C7180F3